MNWSADWADARCNWRSRAAAPIPVLADLANDESFHGTIICSVVPAMYFAPGGPLGGERGESRCSVIASKPGRNARAICSAMPLEEQLRVSEDRKSSTLERCCKQIPIPNRPYALGPAEVSALFLLDRSRTSGADGRSNARSPVRCRKG